MKKLIVIIAIILMNGSVFANEYFLSPGSTKRIPLNIHIDRGAMVLFSKKPKAVTGQTKPFFDVQFLGDRMMIAARKAGAVSNLFVDFGDGTIATLELNGVTIGGTDLMRLTPEFKKPVIKRKWDRVDFPSDLTFLAAPWKVHKLSESAKRGGIKARLRYALALDQRLILHLDIINKRNSIFVLSDISVSIAKLGGLRGSTILESQTVPSAVHMQVSELGAGEKASGTIILPHVEFEHDHALIINVSDGISEGPQLMVTL